MKNRYRGSFNDSWRDDDYNRYRNTNYNDRFGNDSYRRNSEYDNYDDRSLSRRGYNSSYNDYDGFSGDRYYSDRGYNPDADSRRYGRENGYNQTGYDERMRSAENSRNDNGYYSRRNPNADWYRSNWNNNDNRDWWEKTKDEVSSWFGDEDAQRRRRMDEWREDHRGKGPKNYKRSSERIKEDVNDKLGDNWLLDASNIEVTVDGSEVTLNGTVDNRQSKRRAEDIAEDVSGVTHVQNNLRVANNDNVTDPDTNTVYKSKTRKEMISHN